MWRPPERIKWTPQPGRWPTRDEAAASRLFQPIDIGPLALENPVLGPGHGAVAGDRGRHRHARGAGLVMSVSPAAVPAAIVVEATGIRDIPSGPLLRIGDDRFIPGLKSLVDAVARASGGHTRLLIQIIDFLAIRRRPRRDRFLGEFLRITGDHRTRLNAAGWTEERIRAHLAELDDTALQAILSPREFEALQTGYRERVTDLDLPHIRALPGVLPDLFADAARRAREAGFDGVELHYAHAYTMSQFLSRLNDRDDGYGGSPGHRARLPLEVFRRVREAVGEDFPVGCRYLAEDCVDGGNTAEDAAYFGAAFAEAGFDFLSLSRGGRFRGRQAAVGRRRRLPLYRAERIRVHAAICFRRARPVRAQCRTRHRDTRRDSGGRTPNAGGGHRRHPRLRAGRSAVAGRQGRYRGLRPAKPRRPRTGSSRCGWGAATRWWSASTPITARRSTRSTYRSHASSGTASSVTSRASG